MAPKMPELPEQASSARGPSPQTDGLSIQEASEQYGISQSTLRRRLAAKAIPGAFTVSGPKGDEWRLPEGGLEAAGFQRIEKRLEKTEGEELVASVDLRQLMTSIQTLTDQLTRSQLQLEAASSEKGELSVELARQEERLAAANREISELRERLDNASRRWWQRKPKTPADNPSLPPSNGS